MSDYSQRGEQPIILEALGYPADWEADDTSPGQARFLDIGAFDGIHYSNTRALAELGWGGLLVEPAAWAFDRLALLYHPRGDIDLVQALIGCDPGVNLASVHYSGADALTTTDERHAADWEKHGAHFRRVWMPPLHPDRLLQAFPGPYRFISIDTEKTSVAILRALIEATHRQLLHLPAREQKPGLQMLGCDVLCVEHDDRQDYVEGLCPGYEVVLMNGENMILVRQ